MIIRQALITDLENIIEIGKETFFETFSKSHSENLVEDYIKINFTTEKISKELNDKCSMFFLALDNDQVAGYLKVNVEESQTEIQEENSLEIQRIYVKASYQGKKVGQLLFNKALVIAKEQQREFVWLGVWENNKKAINFYEKNGFITFGEHTFVMGDQKQNDLMLKKVIS